MIVTDDRPDPCQTDLGTPDACTNQASVSIGHEGVRLCADCAADLRLPICEPYRAGETVVDHGARVLTFLLQTNVTATLSDEELRRAEIAAKYAIVARGISVPAADRISDVRHVIAWVLKDRRELEGSAAGALSSLDDRPNEGPMAKLVPEPIVTPPVGEAIDPIAYELDRIINEPRKDRIQF